MKGGVICAPRAQHGRVPDIQIKTVGIDPLLTEVLFY